MFFFGWHISAEASHMTASYNVHYYCAQRTYYRLQDVHIRVVCLACCSQDESDEEEEVVWMTDTSAEAVAARAAEQLTAATAALVTQGNIEAEKAEAKKRAKAEAKKKVRSKGIVVQQQQH